MSEMLFEPLFFTDNNFFPLDAFESIEEDWDVRRTRINSGEIDVNLSFFQTPRLQFSSVHYTNAIFMEGTPPQGTMMISFIKSSDNCSFQNNILEPYELIILQHGQEIDFLANNAHTIYNLAIEEGFFTRSFFQYFNQELHQTIKQQKLKIKEKDIESFLQGMKSILSGFQHLEQKMEPHLYNNIEQNILNSFFSYIEIENRKTSKIKFDISKAREILHENIDNFYTIGDLVEELHISSRTLQYNFKSRLGLSPKEYIHYLRLNAIRKILISGDSTTVTISTLISKYGFLHPSHFGVEYKRVFGETPSQTLKKKQ